ncbi:MAG: NAD(P)/FAD-dependent oxidoreductase [Mycobacteriaceae bacterium]
MRDLVVVGAGPAGLATALHAARAGWSVTVLERRPGDGDKACGEGLMPAALRELALLGVDPDGHDITGITYRQGHHVARSTFRAGPGRGVRRTTLHTHLRDAATAAGVEIAAGDGRKVVQHDDHVRVDGRDARWLVGADGLHSQVREAVGPVRPRRAPRWGLRRHYALTPWSSTVEVTWGDTTEVYVTPVGPGTVGVAVLTSAPGPWPQQLACFGELRERVAGAAEVSTVRGAGPLRQHVRRRVAGRVLLVGDAAGYVDALTGEGISVALASARVLVEALVAGEPQRYEAAWRRVSREPRLLTAGLLAARRTPVLNRVVVPAAAALPRLFGAVVDRLAG